MVRKKSLSDLRVMQRPVRNNPQPSLLASPEAKDEDDFEDDDFDDEEDEESEDEDEDEESVDEGESDKSEEPPVKEKAKRGGKVASTEKMLLKLRMSSTRQQPVWADAKVTLSARGFERSAELAREVEAAITKFRRVLDAEAKLKAAEDARRELDGIIAG
jgi:hypothetical protein